MKYYLTLMFLGSACLGCRAVGPQRSGVISTAPGSSSVSSVPHAFKVFPVYSDKAPRHTHYAPSGYMGDSDLTLSGAYTKTPNGEGPCLRVKYTATGPKGWVGIYWQDPANNWGDTPGRAGYDLRGATRLTFWARGENGGERVHEFKMGGIFGPYPDSDVAKLSNIRLTKEWKQYSIDLAKMDLRHIIGGFGFSLLKAENPGGMVFYLDDILYEGPQTQGAQPTPAPSPSLVGQLPVDTTIQAAALVAVTTPAASAPPASKDLEVKQIDTGLKVSFSSRLMFTPAQANLEAVSGKVLDQLISLLSAYPSSRVLVEGHTDSTGDKHFNLRLSELRAKAVRDYLIKHGGYEASRFQVTGYGDTKPIADNATKVGRSLNRRVEVTILKEAKP